MTPMKDTHFAKLFFELSKCQHVRLPRRTRGPLHTTQITPGQGPTRTPPDTLRKPFVFLMPLRCWVPTITSRDPRGNTTQREDRGPPQFRPRYPQGSPGTPHGSTATPQGALRDPSESPRCIPRPPSTRTGGMREAIEFLTKRCSLGSYI